MRRVTILWFLVAACLGVALFLVKYEVQDREEKLAALHREILANQEAVHVLEAEWSYLNRPSNLEAMVRRHLDLVPLDTTRLGRIEQLPIRLPSFEEAGTMTAGIREAAAATDDLPAFAPPAPLPRPITISAKVRR
ncbi:MULTISPECIES: cell division protein FtsL [Thalassobaculum]|uniref:Cell division protein FtsL n=1 Tax=Thalassobaculum litoreum DSM 18839 TaxID=1123362 RepID=A0A8G2BKB6_9PROT|nr:MULTISPECIES: hypothetical protein [Thalassobaculum]SDF86276.1 hypothetical protein SAMN05660686_02592 [Thalassobaculum litoreum DSM 18839]